MAKSAIGDGEIKKLLDKGLSKSAIARHFTDRGRPITQQAISLRVKKILEGDEDRSKYILPWVIRTPTHTQGWVYRAVKAYAKYRRGRGVTPQEISHARELEDMLTKHDAVITYDYNKGFMLRSRRPEDGANLLV